MIYLDYAASAPPWEEAVQAVQRTMLERFGNPGALHGAGGEARAVLWESRKSIAELLDVRPEEVFFTSGGTEANNWAVRMGCERGKRHIIAAATEHRSVLEPAGRLREQGYELTVLNPGEDGIIAPETVEAAIRRDTALICVQAVNNETGVMQDVAGLAALARKYGVRYLCDGVQSFGHMDQPLNRADFVSVSAHKLGGPRGVGCLVVRYPNMIAPLIDGGGQEYGGRSGTENLPGIAGFAAAARLSVRSLGEELRRLEELSGALVRGIKEAAPRMKLNGGAGRRYPGIISCWFPGIPAEEMVMRLDLSGVCVSPGAACAARDAMPSHVLLAMGYDERRAKESVRFSLGRLTTAEEIGYTVKAVRSIVRGR